MRLEADTSMSDILYVHTREGEAEASQVPIVIVIVVRRLEQRR